MRAWTSNFRRPSAVRALAGGLALAVVFLGSADPLQARKRKGGESEAAAARDDAREMEARKQYEFGYRFYREGMLAKARESLQQALSIEPEYAEARYVLALIHVELNEPRAAITECQRALEANHFFTEAHNLMGLAYARTGDFQSAMREFQIVLSDINFPTPEVAHFNIAKVTREMNACGESLAHLRKALELNPTFSKAWHLMGDCYEVLGQSAEARSAYERSVEIDADNVETQYRLGYLCFLQKDFSCARQSLDRVRLLDPAGELGGAARELLRQINFR